MKEKNIVRRERLLRFRAWKAEREGKGEYGGENRASVVPARGGDRSARRIARRAGPAVDVFRQRIDNVDHALPVEQCLVGCGRACRQRGPHRLRAPLHAQRLLRQNFWRSPRLTIACDRESDEWPFALSDTDAVASTGRPSASSVVPDACWYAPSRYTLVRFDRS